MSRPPRFALHHPIVEGTAMVDGAELHHLRDVMRLREGDRLALLAGDGVEHLARIERFEEHRAIMRIEKTSTAGGTPPLILATAIIKGPRMDFVVEKAAEVGVTELWPMLCERGVAGVPGTERIARWHRVAIAAAKQSLAPAAMELRHPIAYPELFQTIVIDRLSACAPLKLICAMGAPPIASVIRRGKPRAIIIACGPEGDFTEAELKLAKGAGFVAVGLGRNRLRSETAAIAAAGVAAALLDELLEEPDRGE